jgi:hypothetical protein
VKIDLPSHQHLLAPSLPPGIFPYLGGSVGMDQLKSAVADCGSAVVSGKQGAKLARELPGILIDPAAYAPQGRTEPTGLFDYDDWLIRQQAADVPVILTDTPRLPNNNRLALHEALTRWDELDQPTLVVLPIESWWLRPGLAWLTEEVRAAGRPVAIVLLHQFNGLDPAGAVAGLLRFIADVAPLPVVLLRCDISAIGAVAHGAFAGFVGWGTGGRHGPLPIRPAKADDQRDDSPSVLVPALTDYLKTSKLPALRDRGLDDRALDVLRCDDPVCGGESLLRIAELSEASVRDGRLLAGRHNLASTEQLARRILADAEPRDAWRETCRAGTAASASLAESGVSLPESRWLRQWLELGSPSHRYQGVR